MVLKQTKAVPPILKKVPTESCFFSDNRVDNYAWLADQKNPQVQEVIVCENSYTANVSENIASLQQSLRDEMLQNVNSNEFILLFELEGYEYFRQTSENKKYPSYCRQKIGQRAYEILLDFDLIAKNCDFKKLGSFKISPNQQLLAYTLDTQGSENYTLFIKDLKNLTVEQIDSTSDSVEWGNDSKTIYYVSCAPDRANEFFSYRYLEPLSKTVLYREQDKAFSLWLKKSKNKQFIFLYANSNNTVEAYAKDADNQEEPLRLVCKRTVGVEYYLEAHNLFFLILTNENAPNFKVLKVLQSDLLKTQELISHQSDIVIDELDVFEKYIVIYERHNEKNFIRVLNLKTGELKAVNFPDQLYTLKKKSHNLFETDQLYFYYQSYLTPRSLMIYNMALSQITTKQRQFINNSYLQTDYLAYQIFAKSHDGESIPITLIHKKGIVLDASAPLWLTAYGAYGLNIEPFFSAERLILLKKGFIFAIAHVRGGSDFGYAWYEQGKLLNKINSFKDFIACANYLIQQRFTSSEKLIIEGASAGGLLIAAVLNMAPGLCNIAILKSPFVEVLNTMLNEQALDVVSEYEEWGDPHQKEYYDYLKSYCPYENVRTQSYPHLLVTTALHDCRVPCTSVLKWVAKIRELKTDDHLLFLKIDSLGGHDDESGQFDYFERIAFKYAFVLDLLDRI